MRFFIISLVVSVSLLSSIGADEIPKSDRPTNLPCVTKRAEARFVGVAYNHLVHLGNACTYPVSCVVGTDVNPTPKTVTLAPKEKKTHLSFRGSPARVFKATVTCKRIE